MTDTSAFGTIETSYHRSMRYEPLPTPAELQEIGDRLGTPVTWERRIIGGSAGEIIDTVGALRNDVGVPVEWVARSYFPDLTYDRQVAIADRLASDVMPFLPTG